MERHILLDKKDMRALSDRRTIVIKFDPPLIEPTGQACCGVKIVNWSNKSPRNYRPSYWDVTEHPTKRSRKQTGKREG